MNPDSLTNNPSKMLCLIRSQVYRKPFFFINTFDENFFITCFRCEDQLKVKVWLLFRMFEITIFHSSKRFSVRDPFHLYISRQT